jgi:hypothetical protein
MARSSGWAFHGGSSGLRESALFDEGRDRTHQKSSRRTLAPSDLTSQIHHRVVYCTVRVVGQRGDKADG